MEDAAHRRWNPLTQTWLVCSPHRTKRPWLGAAESPSEDLPKYDPKCFLCPGNKRANEGEINPKYEDTFVFTNDYSAFIDLPEGVEGKVMDLEQDLLRIEPVSGICKVICFSPRHDLTLGEMNQQGIVKVIHTWRREFEEMGKQKDIQYVQIFENKGSAMGCSNPHPHCQIWAGSFIPKEVSLEITSMQAYTKKHHSCMLCGYNKVESEKKVRIIAENEHFIAVVPFWALWPYETLVTSKDHIGSLSDFSANHTEAFADILRQVTVRYDNLFKCPFPYSMGLHQTPNDGQPHPEFHFHVHFYPPLLRSATVKKFMVGYEMLGEPQRDITAEGAANTLRSLPDVHYKHGQV
eukprot:TRINITY_DN2386_c0_g1_i1.p1 TRINITY_DN2386_c0_g1~~TRINITY_DN2386_c0_g1_i1.p1  ORF type:complete len:350 (+),score=47.23 TRINITY_DN2386_c0_g1_i1:85-1134(+)